MERKWRGVFGTGTGKFIYPYGALFAMDNLKRLVLVGPADFVERWEKEIRKKGFPEKSLLAVKDAERLRA